jgi:hypothetical protein
VIERFQRDFHNRKHFWKSFRLCVLITFCDTVWISIMLWKCLHLGLNFIFGNRRKSQRAWSGEEERWGMTVICVEPKNYCTMSDAWAGTLSWCWVQDLLHHLSGSLCWMFWLQSPQNIATEFCTHRLSQWNNIVMHDAFNIKRLQHFRLCFRSKVIKNTFHHRLTSVSSWNV